MRWCEANAEGHVDITSHLRYLIETAWDWAAALSLARLIEYRRGRWRQAASMAAALEGRAAAGS